MTIYGRPCKGVSLDICYILALRLPMPPLFLVSILQTAHLWANTGVVFRELSFSRLECGVHDRLHIYPLCGIFYFPWHRHQIEGTNGFYCLIRKTERFTISNVESQVFTPNYNSRLDPGSNPGCPRDKRMSYHWSNCACQGKYKYPTSLHCHWKCVRSCRGLHMLA